MIIQNYGSSINGIISSITQFLAYITLLEAGMGPVVKAALYKPIAQKNKKEIELILKQTEQFFHKVAYIFIGYLFVLCIIFPLLYQENYDFLFIFSLVIIIAISTFFEYFFGMTYSIYLQAEQQNYVLSLFKIVGKLMNTVFLVFLISKHSSIHLVKLVSAFIFLLIPLMQNYYVKKKYNIHLKNVSKEYTIKNKWAGFSQHIAAIIHTNTDIAILTLFSNSLEVSVYSVYMLVINSMRAMITSIPNALSSTFGDMIAKEEYENLNKKFAMVEWLYYTMITILFSSTLLLILPFIKLYTAGITDVNYHRPLFAFIITLAEFMYIQRLPYNSLNLSAGYFKELKTGAWIEAFINVTVSILLVKKLGLVGIALGTLISVFIRTLEHILFATKHILKRKQSTTLKKYLFSYLEILIILLLFHFLPTWNITNYITWIFYALLLTIFISLFVISANRILYKDEYQAACQFLKNIGKDIKNKVWKKKGTI